MKTRLKTLPENNKKSEIEIKEIVKQGIIFGDKNQYTKRIIISEDKKKKILNNINLRNNQNYMLSKQKIENIEFVYAFGSHSRLTTFKFENLKTSELYFLNNDDLNKADSLIKGENMTVGLGFLLMFLIVFFTIYITEISILFKVIYMLIITLIIFIPLKFTLFRKSSNANKKIEYKNNKLYFIRDVEGIYYFIK